MNVEPMDYDLLIKIIKLLYKLIINDTIIICAFLGSFSIFSESGVAVLYGFNLIYVLNQFTVISFTFTNFVNISSYYFVEINTNFKENILNSNKF